MSSLPDPIHRETRHMLRERTGEHLRAVMRNLPGLPVAEHFNMPGHGLDDMEVRCVKQCQMLWRNAPNFSSWHPSATWTKHEFYFLNHLTRAHFYPSVRIVLTTVNLFNALSHSKLNIKHWRRARPETSAIYIIFTLALQVPFGSQIYIKNDTLFKAKAWKMTPWWRQFNFISFL